MPSPSLAFGSMFLNLKHHLYPRSCQSTPSLIGMLLTICHCESPLLLHCHLCTLLLLLTSHICIQNIILNAASTMEHKQSCFGQFLKNKEEKHCFAFASLFSLEVKRKWISCSVDCFIQNVIQVKVRSTVILAFCSSLCNCSSDVISYLSLINDEKRLFVVIVMRGGKSEVLCFDI